jgi:hypothetical protein
MNDAHFIGFGVANADLSFVPVAAAAAVHKDKSFIILKPEIIKSVIGFALAFTTNRKGFLLGAEAS